MYRVWEYVWKRETDRQTQNPGTDKEFLHGAGMDTMINKSWKVHLELIDLPVNLNILIEEEAGLGLGESTSWIEKTECMRKAG